MELSQTELEMREAAYSAAMAATAFAEQAVQHYVAKGELETRLPREKVSMRTLTTRETSASMISIHEASHAVVASLLQILKSVHIRRGNGDSLYAEFSGLDEHGSTDTSIDMGNMTLTYVHKRVLTLMAPSVVSGILGYNDGLWRGDVFAIHVTAALFFGVTDLEDGWFGSYRTLTEKIVNSSSVREAIALVAEELDKNEELLGDEVLNIVQSVSPPITLPDEVLELLKA
jgi:hypothetical protein